MSLIIIIIIKIIIIIFIIIKKLFIQSTFYNSFRLKKKRRRHLISIEKNIYEAHAIITHAWVAFKRQSSMKSPYGILWKGVLEPLTHVRTDLKISKESNVLIQVIVM